MTQSYVIERGNVPVLSQEMGHIKPLPAGIGWLRIAETVINHKPQPQPVDGFSGKFQHVALEVDFPTSLDVSNRVPAESGRLNRFETPIAFTGWIALGDAVVPVEGTHYRSGNLWGRLYSEPEAAQDLSSFPELRIAQELLRYIKREKS